jgi:hypothetical protein
VTRALSIRIVAAATLLLVGAAAAGKQETHPVERNSLASQAELRFAHFVDALAKLKADDSVQIDRRDSADSSVDQPTIEPAFDAASAWPWVAIGAIVALLGSIALAARRRLPFLK